MVCETGMNLYCKIFVNARMSRGDLVRLVRDGIGGAVELGHYIDASFCSIDVLINPDASLSAAEDEDRFLYYPYYFEVDVRDEAQECEYVWQVSQVMNLLKGNGIDAVASCDFEDRL